MGANKSIFCLKSRIVLLAKEVSLTDTQEPREGKQLVQGGSAVIGKARFLPLPVANSKSEPLGVAFRPGTPRHLYLSSFRSY